jgi:hypothetical protein
MSFPPHLLDTLARVFARVALERLLEEQTARNPRQEEESDDSGCDSPPPKNHEVDEGGVTG